MDGRYSIGMLIFGLVLVAAIVVLEMVLSVKWNRAYYTVGFPIFLKRVDTTLRLDDLSFEQLQKSTATAAGAPLVFKRVAPDAIAFRDQPLAGFLHYAPLMRGVIRRREGEAAIVVAGLVNWSFLALVLYFGIFLGRHVVDVLPMFLLAFSVLYLIQGVRYWRLGRGIAAGPVQNASTGAASL
jgi:hypothetical protein